MASLPVSDRTRKIMLLVVPPPPCQDDASDEEYFSDESLREDNDQIEYAYSDENCSDIDEDLLLNEEIVPLPTNYEADLEEVVINNNGESEEDSLDNLPLCYYGKERCFAWNSFVPTNSRNTANHNIIRMKLPALQAEARNFDETVTSEQIWRLLFDEIIINEIVMHTNNKLKSMREKLKDKQSPNYKDTDSVEIDALIGLLMLCSIFKSGKEDLSSLFSTGVRGRPIFRGIMSLKRCQTLLLALRFDNALTREARKETDRAAAISFIFNRFISNSLNNYAIGNCACIDEMLLAFRGKCPFRIYMPNKPAKYGIKIMCLTDAHSSYLYNAYIYMLEKIVMVTLYRLMKENFLNLLKQFLG